MELLTNNEILLIFEKGIRGGLCHAIHSYAKLNNKYMKNYDKNIDRIMMSHAFRWKQFVLMGNVSKIACKRF